MLLAGVILLPWVAVARDLGLRRIALADLRDKIEGGWAGQMIGMGFGRPLQWKFRGTIIEGDLPAWSPQKAGVSLNEDGLYVDMTLAKVLDEKGLAATAEHFEAGLLGAGHRLWQSERPARLAARGSRQAERHPPLQCARQRPGLPD